MGSDTDLQVRFDETNNEDNKKVIYVSQGPGRACGAVTVSVLESKGGG